MATKVAVIQKPPVLLDRQKTISCMLDSIDEAVAEGASLLDARADIFSFSVNRQPLDPVSFSD